MKDYMKKVVRIGFSISFVFYLFALISTFSERYAKTPIFILPSKIALIYMLIVLNGIKFEEFIIYSANDRSNQISPFHRIDWYKLIGYTHLNPSQKTTNSLVAFYNFYHKNSNLLKN